MKKSIGCLRWVVASVLLAMTSLVALPAHAGKAHRHGVGLMELAFEGNRLTVSVDIPLDSLVGFERAPRTEAERKAAADALVAVRNAAAWMRLDAAAACRVEQASVSAPVLEGGKSASDDGHAQLEAQWVWVCNDLARVSRVEVNLFDLFKRLDKLEGQAVLLKGQKKFAVSRAARIVQVAP